MGQISLYDGPLAQFGETGKYGDLFVTALKSYGMLCIGLYRYRYEHCSQLQVISPSISLNQVLCLFTFSRSLRNDCHSQATGPLRLTGRLVTLVNLTRYDLAIVPFDDGHSKAHPAPYNFQHIFFPLFSTSQFALPSFQILKFF